jgi:hypothetical protein
MPAKLTAKELREFGAGMITKDNQLALNSAIESHATLNVDVEHTKQVFLDLMTNRATGTVTENEQHKEQRIAAFKACTAAKALAYKAETEARAAAFAAGAAGRAETAAKQLAARQARAAAKKLEQPNIMATKQSDRNKRTTKATQAFNSKTFNEKSAAAKLLIHGATDSTGTEDLHPGEAFVSRSSATCSKPTHSNVTPEERTKNINYDAAHYQVYLTVPTFKTA